ncbi:exopolysaccharide biosynthesis polyprenyl glycosylphosphotransferase [Frigoriflavimonas asaccharolytica]|uniref:Putative colanic acid biosynthesis UDP-glucose lipid carrier transferase n=1 Tax=Frigoriflavimonas asaccharolytica TaxID=2735899 RepID=A0A8J8K8T1_9FLAO|nr:exopolysaccharide biosynthesis polyprenyl glycosylphosphotransferase [Frigoriflavimonas asaccharolytica]NRS92282.1 putative colanic acid biosynthesis UDP-glucose lipid carrier transferase [Frigoriflavimonas asaccharolytica]
MQRLRYSRYLKIGVILLDIIVISLVFVFFFIERNRDLQLNTDLWEQNALSIVLLTLFWILLSGRTKLYTIPRNLTYTLYLERFVSHMLIFLFGIILLGKVSNNPFLKSERFWLAISLFILLLLLKSSIFFAVKYLRSRGINFRNIMFLGQKTDSREILENIMQERKDYGFRIKEFGNQDLEVEKLVAFWKEEQIHTLYFPVDNSNINKELEGKIHSAAEVNKVRIVLIPHIVNNNFFEYELNYIETQPILTPAKFPLDFFTNYLLKRIFDILFSLIILVLICSWLFPIIAILIKIDSKGAIFFRQLRFGYHDEVFSCIKFRTMFENEENATQTTQINDVRITKIGNFLRRSSLDEMPQFINVLLGQMSVVGPRPHMLLVDKYYKAKIGRYTVRSLVKPGITGLAQVSGLRGDMGDMSIEMKKRILADIFYVKNWSLVLDFVIVVKTTFLFIKGDKKAR